MNNKKNPHMDTAKILFRISAALFCISAILCFVRKDTGYGVTQLSLGLTFFFLSMTVDENAKKSKKGDTKPSEQESPATDETVSAADTNEE